MAGWNPSRRGALALGALAWVWPLGALAMVHERRHLFGSPVDLLLPEDAPPAAATEVLAGLQRIHQRWNAWKPGEVSSLNRAFRAGQSAEASAALRSLIRGAKRMELSSLGHFNAGIGALVGAWGFHDDELRPGARPGAVQLAALVRARPSLAQLEIRGREVYSPNPALQLDFGGYAKGAAIDWALDRLQGMGVHDALLNLGGNLATMGRAQRRRWRVGIRDPQGPGLAAVVETHGREAVVTSGVYERWRELDGQRYAHIIDPAGGAPVDAIASVTVVHANAALADAAATALLVAGRGRWRVVAERMAVAQVLVIDRHGRAEATPAMAARLLRSG